MGGPTDITASQIVDDVKATEEAAKTTETASEVTAPVTDVEASE